MDQNYHQMPSIQKFQKEKFITLLLSENYDEYLNGLEYFKQFLDLQDSELEYSIKIIIKKQLIPRILFNLEWSCCLYQMDVLKQINFIQEMLKKYNFQNSFIKNGLMHTLIKIIQLKNKNYDNVIIRFLVMILHSIQNKYKQDIQNQIIIFVGVQKVMQMIEYQPHQTIKIKQIALLCNLQDQNYFKEKKIFIEELCQILLKEPNQSGQFIVAVELISDIIVFDRIKQLILEKNVLQPMIEAIPNWILKYRSVLDSILKICLEFIMFNNIVKQLIVTKGLLKHLGALIQSQFYGVRSYSYLIVQQLAKDKIMVERLFLNSIIDILLEQYLKNQKSFELISLLTIIFEQSINMFSKYCKNRSNEFIQAFLSTFLSFQELEISKIQFKLIKILKDQELFQFEIQQYFLEHKVIINERMRQFNFFDSELQKFI
ncbi:unnamed protein product [Paramecium sonneborni]|uniref:Uncharacterized protein n=1 Tax=Paramecium sonneborni TaxID=65129 RepID=A0A8S1RJ40_9CILI|nr:unnamed protein product [Paramecium sonneborni]